MRHFLDFEKPIAELEGKIEELRRMSDPDGINIAEEVSRLTDKAAVSYTHLDVYKRQARTSASASACVTLTRVPPMVAVPRPSALTSRLVLPIRRFCHM